VKALVTGAAGFIGTWLCDELAATGHDVIGVDLMSGARTSAWRSELADLLDPAVAGELIEGHRPDVVVHLAAHVGRVFGEDDRAHTVNANATMTTLVAAAAAHAGARMVYVSSSEVYGDHGHAVITEDTPWRIPHNLYGLSKGWGEQVCELYAPAGLTVLRVSMPYGPGVAPGRGRRAMDTILWQAHHGLPITAYRDTERSWCWIGDTVAGMRMAIEAPGGGVYNVGRDDQPISMEHLAKHACDLAGRMYDIIRPLKAPPTETLVKRLDCSRLRALGWQPHVDLEVGMKAVYQWVRRFDATGALR
jgi:dTDP-glucose 4,6-dehydratase